MVVPISGQFKHHLDVGVEALGPVLAEVGGDIEADAVDAFGELGIHGKKIGHATIGVGAAHGDILPFMRSRGALQGDPDATSRFAAGGVEDVG